MVNALKRSYSGDPSFVACKRLRINSRRHETYYFPDGNVILTLQDVQFRVHLSQLSRKSNFFKSLFENQNKESSSDGTRIYFSNDDPDDFAASLQCIYDGMQLFEREDLDFDFLTSIIRSSSKYEFNKARDWAIARLDKLIPTSLEDFNTDAQLERAPMAILLARQCNLRSLLKPAFYRMVRARRYSPNLVGNISGDNNNNNNNPPYDPEAFAEAEALLPKEDIILASHLLREFTARWMTIATTVPSPKCKTSHSKCPSVFVNHWWVKVVKSSRIFQNGVFDPLGSLDSLIAIDWSIEGVCADCLSLQRNVWKNHKRKLWEDIDEWIEADEQARLLPPKQEGMDEATLLLPPRNPEEGSQHINGVDGITNLANSSTGPEDMDEGE